MTDIANVIDITNIPKVFRGIIKRMEELTHRNADMHRGKPSRRSSRTSTIYRGGRHVNLGKRLPLSYYWVNGSIRERSLHPTKGFRDRLYERAPVIVGGQGVIGTLTLNY